MQPQGASWTQNYYLGRRAPTMVLANTARPTLALLLWMVAPASTSHAPPGCLSHCEEPCTNLNGNVEEECGACSEPTACRPGAEGYENWEERANGCFPTYLIGPVMILIFTAIVSRRVCRQQRPVAQQQNHTGNVPMPTSQAQAVAMQPAADLTTMQIMLPPDAQPGQSVQINVQGQMMAVTVPPGAQPGGPLTINVPSGAGMQGVQMAQPVCPPQAAPPTVVMGVPIN